jgi:hypothetical protein
MSRLPQGVALRDAGTKPAPKASPMVMHMLGMAP